MKTRLHHQQHDLLILLFLSAVFIGCTALSWQTIRGLWHPVDTFLTTPGQIVRSRVTIGSDRGWTFYRYRIDYIYIVDGQRYQSDQISFDKATDDTPAFAQSYVDKYPRGSSVTVYYDPTDPTFAVLEPENKDYSVWFFPCISGILLLFVVIKIIHLGKTYQHHQPA